MIIFFLIDFDVWDSDELGRCITYYLSDVSESDVFESDVYQSDVYESDVYKSDVYESEVCESDISESDDSKCQSESDFNLVFMNFNVFQASIYTYIYKLISTKQNIWSMRVYPNFYKKFFTFFLYSI